MSNQQKRRDRRQKNKVLKLQSATSDAPPKVPEKQPDDGAKMADPNAPKFVMVPEALYDAMLAEIRKNNPIVDIWADAQVVAQMHNQTHYPDPSAE